MSKKKKTTTQSVRGTSDVLRDAWLTTQGALVSAEALRKLGLRVEKGRKKALKQVEARLATLQARVHKERLVAGRMVDDAVKAALATFNIPSRKEVAELTRKVDELSRKIDGLKRRR